MTTRSGPLSARTHVARWPAAHLGHAPFRPRRRRRQRDDAEVAEPLDRDLVAEDDRQRSRRVQLGDRRAPVGADHVVIGGDQHVEPFGQVRRRSIDQRHRRVRRRRRVLMRIDAAPAERVDDALERRAPPVPSRRRRRRRAAPAPCTAGRATPARDSVPAAAAARPSPSRSPRDCCASAANGGPRCGSRVGATPRIVSRAGTGAPFSQHAIGERSLARHDDVVRGAGALADGDVELCRPACARCPRRARDNRPPATAPRSPAPSSASSPPALRDRRSRRARPRATRPSPPRECGRTGAPSAPCAACASASYSDVSVGDADDQPARHLDARARRQVDDLRIEVGPLPVVARVERPFGDGVGVRGVLAEACDVAGVDRGSPRRVEPLVRHEALRASPVDGVADGQLLERALAVVGQRRRDAQRARRPARSAYSVSMASVASSESWPRAISTAPPPAPVRSTTSTRS